ncbi:protein kinase domain protein [Metarhizium rileyi]|uniref:non-specific serine/threonine protein kinase n=1 Tax=Metarhizium rileyi (strain RCEF 4871) TaxID=1649241 RepID=A0A162JMA5_METRR|nr:protein kinase domain protein [Metarhizium rileyi RCEF 4871]
MRYLLRQILYQRLACKNRHFPTNFSRMMSTSNAKYEYVEDVEDISRYVVGGFHPVRIGDCYHGRYRVVHKLGHGAYATIWLAKDLQLMKYVALKIGIADWETNEADILTTLTKDKSAFNNHFPLLLDQFSLTGPNGKHKCLVLEAARCSLAASKEASWIRLFNLSTARILSAQMVIAIHQIHSRGYIHNDLHLGNVLLQLPYSFSALSEEQIYSQFGRPMPQAVVREDRASLSSNVPGYVYESIWLGMPTETLAIQDAKILLSDFGVAFQPQKESRLQSNTPINVRPPETRFEQSTPLTPAADIWSLACMIWDVMAQRPLFGEILATSDMMTSQQVNTLGTLPRDWWDKWNAKWEFFKQDGTPIESRRTPSWSRRFERDIQEPRHENNLGGILDTEEVQAFTSMLQSMLAYRPANRPTAEEVLKTEWMRKYALPELEMASIASKTI